MSLHLRDRDDRAHRSAPPRLPVVSVRPRRLYASVEVDCFRSGPITDPSCASLARYMVAWACTPGRAWASLEFGPVSYGTTRAPVDRANVLARVMVDLWRGEADEALTILANSSAADRDRIRCMSAQRHGVCLARGATK
jgi:hypothetical protein